MRPVGVAAVCEGLAPGDSLGCLALRCGRQRGQGAQHAGRQLGRDDVLSVGLRLVHPRALFVSIARDRSAADTARSLLKHRRERRRTPLCEHTRARAGRHRGWQHGHAEVV